jgi:hypothetical protein
MRTLLIFAGIVLLSLIPDDVSAQAGIDVESGFIRSGYNDARIPGDDGTLFSFSEELTSDNEFYYRLRLNYRFGAKHTVSLLLAPLKIHAQGSFDQDVIFQELAKIRDAEIGLKNDDQESSKVNVGFVPIINFRALYKMNEQWGFLLEGDALAAPQGRAEDVLAAITYHASDKATVKLGYRILEGGAGNDEVYTYSLINYLALAVNLQF